MPKETRLPGAPALRYSTSKPEIPKGGYTPLAATITHEKIYQAIYKKQDHYVHGHTYGGNPLSCAVGLAVQEYIEKHGLIVQCAEMGDLMLEEMKALENSPIVSIVRGKGLLLGVEFVADKETLEPFEGAEKPLFLQLKL